MRYETSSLPGPDSSQVLREFYSKTDDKAAKSAVIGALGNQKDEVSVSFLEGLLKESYPVYRSEALKALFHVNDPSSYKDIAGALSDIDEGVRVVAAKTCGKLKITTSVSALLKSLYDPSIRVKLAAINALGDIGDKTALPRL